MTESMTFARQPLAMALLVGVLGGGMARTSDAQQAGALTSLPTPIILDTDIGTDIDDAFALALVLRSPELDLLGVTTVSGDTEARARLTAKLLTEAGQLLVPVVAGKPGKPLPIAQASWANGFSGPQLWRESTSHFMHSQVEKNRLPVTLVAIGPLTNVAAFITEYPADARKLKRIVMMGGSIAHGYGTSLTPEAEYNVAADPQAARIVFNSGIPILMVPLDVTAMQQLEPAERRRLFEHRTLLTADLQKLYKLWGQPTPTLFDPVAVAMIIKPDLCRTKQLAIEVDDKGFTRVVPGKKPNAEVALTTNRQAFFNFYLMRVAP